MEKDSSGNSTCELSFLVKNCICFELSSASASQKVSLSCILRKQNKKRNFAPGALIQSKSRCEVVVPVWAAVSCSEHGAHTAMDPAGPALDTSHCPQVTVLCLCGSRDFVPMLESGFAVHWWSFRSRHTGAALVSVPVIPGTLCCPCWNVWSWAVLLVLSSIPPLHRGCCLSWQRHENTPQTKSLIFILICQRLLGLPSKPSLFPLAGISVGK